MSNGRSVVGTADADGGDCERCFRDWMDLVVGRVGEAYGFGADVGGIGGVEANSTCCGGE